MLVFFLRVVKRCAKRKMKDEICVRAQKGCPCVCMCSVCLECCCVIVFKMGPSACESSVWIVWSHSLFALLPLLSVINSMALVCALFSVFLCPRRGVPTKIWARPWVCELSTLFFKKSFCSIGGIRGEGRTFFGPLKRQLGIKEVWMGEGRWEQLKWKMDHYLCLDRTLDRCRPMSFHPFQWRLECHPLSEKSHWSNCASCLRDACRRLARLLHLHDPLAWME